MIKLIESPDKLPRGFSGSLFARIAGTAAAYGYSMPFALFWRQINDVTGEDTAVVSSFDCNMTLCAFDNADFDELAEFLPAVGGQTLLCESNVMDKLGLSSVKEFSVLEFAAEEKTPLSGEDESFSLEELYALLKSGEDGEIELPEHDAWYADMSHRIRHGGAEVFAMRAGNTLAAAAVSPFVSEGMALISGVAVNPHYRGKGLGKNAVAGLAVRLKLSDRRVFVMAEEKLIPFYKSAGFSVCGSVAKIIL